MINETLAVIRRRRSIRQYDTRQISDNELHAILDAALFAPTEMNQQKWHFSVVQSKSALEKMDRITRENKLNSNIAFLVKNAERGDYHTYYNAPTVVIVTGDKQANSIQIDCGAAAQNIVLAAESIGIGSCIITSAAYLFSSTKGQKMKKELGIPKGYEHMCSIALGYKATDKLTVPPRNREVFSYLR